MTSPSKSFTSHVPRDVPRDVPRHAPRHGPRHAPRRALRHGPRQVPPTEPLDRPSLRSGPGPGPDQEGAEHPPALKPAAATTGPATQQAAVTLVATAAEVAHPPDWEDALASVTIDQPLDSVAGFFANESDALDAMRRLSTTLGLSDSQLLLLRPDDGGSWRFALRSRQWASRSRHDAPPGLDNDELLVLMGVTLAGLGGAMLLALDHALLFFVLALSSVAVVAATWVWRASQPQHLARFATIVKGQLVAGHWGLVVHGVLWECQAAAVALIRARSVNWCAVSVTRYAL